MTYSIKIKSSAARALRRIDAPHRRRLIRAIDRLASEPSAGGALKGEFSGLRRLRIGNYRIIYEAIHEQLMILDLRVGYRSKVYR